MRTWIFIGVALASMTALADQEPDAPPDRPAAVMSDEDQKTIKAERERKMAELAGDVKEAERRRKVASQSKNPAALKKARDEVAFAKKQVNAYQKMSDDYWLTRAKERATLEAQARAEEAEQLRDRPLVIEALGLYPNVINLPELAVRVRNQSGKRVEAFTVSAECFNKFDEPVGDFKGNNVYSGIAQTGIADRDTARFTWQLSLHRNTARVRVWVTRARFSDGTEWSQTKAEAVRQGGYFQMSME